MEIFVNDDKLQAEWKSDETLDSIYKTIETWIEKNDRYLLNVEADSKEISFKDLTHLLVEDIKRLDFYIGDEIDMLLTTLKELDTYIDQIGITLIKKEHLIAEDISKLEEGFEWSREVLSYISSVLKLDIVATYKFSNNKNINLAKILKELQLSIHQFKLEYKKENIDKFLKDLAAFKEIINKIETHILAMGSNVEDLVRIIEKFQIKIPTLKATLININEELNIGHDEIALGDLENLSEELNFYIFAIFALEQKLSSENISILEDMQIGKGSFKAMIFNLSSSLENLAQLLERNDIVAVGDFLEYELSDLFEDFNPYLKKIQALVPKNKPLVIS